MNANANPELLNLDHYTVEELTIEDIEITAPAYDSDGMRCGELDLIRLGE